MNDEDNETVSMREERNSLFDQVDDEDDFEDDELCENCGDDGDVRRTDTPDGPQSLCPECRLAHEAFDEEVGAESQDALAAR